MGRCEDKDTHMYIHLDAQQLPTLKMLYAEFQKKRRGGVGVGGGDSAGSKDLVKVCILSIVYKRRC